MTLLRLPRLSLLALAVSFSSPAFADMVAPEWEASHQEWAPKGEAALQGDPTALAELQLVDELCQMEESCEDLSPGDEPNAFQRRVASASVQLGRLYETGFLPGDAFIQAQYFYSLADHLGSPYGSHRLGMLFAGSESASFRSIAHVFLERGLKRGVAASAIGLMKIAERRGDEESAIRYAEMGLGLNPTADDGAPLQRALRSRGLPVRARALSDEFEAMPDLTPVRRSSPDTPYAPYDARPEDQVASCAAISLELASDWDDFRAYDADLTMANADFRRRQDARKTSTSFIPPGRAADIVVEDYASKNRELDALWDALNAANAQHASWGNALTRRQNDFNQRCNFAISLPVYNAVCRGDLGQSDYCKSIQF